MNIGSRASGNETIEMAANYKQPPKFDDKTSYETWSNEIKIWECMTDLDVKKRALAVTLSLTGKARETAVSIAVEKLNDDNGMKTLITELDKVFKKEDKDLAYEAYTTFDTYKRTEGTKIGDYIYQFERFYSMCKDLKMELPDAVLAFKLLDNANLSSREKQLAMTACTELTLASMKSAMKRIFGERTGITSEEGDVSCSSTGPITVKQESAYFVYKQKDRRPVSKTPGAYNKVQVGTNPLNKFGRRSSCAICRSVFHWAKQCPHKDEQANLTELGGNSQQETVDDETETCNITLFTKEASINEVLVTESCGAAVIDTACTKTVCGENWLKQYVGTLKTCDKKKLIKQPSIKRFKFGDGNVVQSSQKVTIPAKIGDTQCNIETEVVRADIPLLLSKQSLKRAGTVLDMSKDKVTMFDQPVDLELTSSGHYCIDISGKKFSDCS